MGYGFTCNQCDTDHPDADPAFMGQLHERWFMTSTEGGMLADHGHSPEQTITLCADCTIDLLL